MYFVSGIMVGFLPVGLAERVLKGNTYGPIMGHRYGHLRSHRGRTADAVGRFGRVQGNHPYDFGCHDWRRRCDVAGRVRERPKNVRPATLS